MKSALIVGASRGLGSSLTKFIGGAIPTLTSVKLVSRRPATFETTLTIDYQNESQDMSLELSQQNLAKTIATEKFDLVIYCAGGGPYGEFKGKEWKDHNWALQVGLLAPMRLVHAWLGSRDPLKDGKFIIVGSRIAGLNPDPNSSSYAASKHGLVGFISSLQSEIEENQNKVWLFSPGYMDTDLLPKNASVRSGGQKIMNADTAAQALLRWIKADGPWHRILN